MKLTALGNTGPYPAPGGACSGYLLENDETKVLLDLGNGALSNYLQMGKIEDITAIILSHLHPDHISDLFVLRYALQQRGMSLPLYAPTRPDEEFKRLEYKDVYKITHLEEGLKFSIGGMDLSFKEMMHPYQDFAIKVKAGRDTFMYTGDTADCQALRDFVKGVDVLLCDCAFLEEVNSEIHLSLEKAIEIANEAAVKRLIMTHFNPEIKPREYFQKGNVLFKGRLSKAEILTKINI